MTSGYNASLAEMAAFHGVATAYEDFRGTPTEVQPDIVRAVLEGLGALEPGEDAALRLLDAARERWSHLLEPVVVAWEGRGALTLRLPADVRPSRVEVALTDEAGATRTVTGRARVVERVEVDGRAFVVRRMPLPPLAHGYYDVVVRIPGSVLLEGRALLISAPVRAYRPSFGHRAFGVFAPLYSLHSKRDEGIGTFGDLARLLAWTRSRGGATVGTLPLLATYHDDPRGVSPYSPVTRLAWDELYLDLSPFRAHGAGDAQRPRAERSPFVDYSEAEQALSALLGAAAVEAWSGARRTQIEAFAADHEVLDAYARFRGARARLGSDWRRWQPPARNGILAEGDIDEETRRLHLSAQFALHEQLAALASSAREGGRGLYLDLPLGSHREGFDAWHFGDAFADGLDTGAPPDSLFIGGQNWQFAPPDPRGVRRSGYEYFRASVRNHLRYAGILRVDHVMGLHRLYVIPRGASASEGTYIAYRPDEAWAILSLESHRARATVIGEDLGTVPSEVRRAMRRHAVGGSYVVQYEATAQRRPTLPRPAALAVASLNTHDMPTFAGWRAGRDIEVLGELGHLEGDNGEARVAREGVLEALRGFLGVPADVQRAELLRACLEWLGRSDADVVLVSLDDLLSAMDAQNLPGTTHEHPNWRRRARLTMEELADDERANELLAALNAARQER